jgi:hypothetical protein
VQDLPYIIDAITYPDPEFYTRDEGQWGHNAELGAIFAQQRARELHADLCKAFGIREELQEYLLPLSMYGNLEDLDDEGDGPFSFVLNTDVTKSKVSPIARPGG